ncbi:MAG TPA: LL-diaminopimelate aminotransferase [Parachlamydiales bacterium]|nr:LL-diaminopimelate aminotransferase [Parachlamydiales bacterium]
MVKLNTHYTKLAGNYLFPEISKRARTRTSTSSLIDLGIGDVTRPLPPAIVQALSQASLEMGNASTFKGYGPSAGYDFLRDAIAKHDYENLIHPEEIFVSDGAKCDIANIQEIFCSSNRVAVPDPTYPVYLDTTVMAGRTRLQLKNGRYGGVVYLACTEENNFCPQPPRESCDLVYLCSPNNPTGSAMDRELLKRWVEYAKQTKAVLLFDGAYEAYIRSPGIPKSIYEIEGAKEVAIEVRSYSKTAGFTGLRLSYTVIPKSLKIFDCGREHSLHALWQRRHDTKFGGAPYPIQKAAEAIYSSPGKEQVKTMIDGYSQNAKFLREGLKQLRLTVYGGLDAPYIWCKAPSALSSWEFFDLLLNKAGIVSVPGSGFGLLGEGFVRFSAFADQSKLTEALTRLRAHL